MAPFSKLSSLLHPKSESTTSSSHSTSSQDKRRSSVASQSSVVDGVPGAAAHLDDPTRTSSPADVYKAQVVRQSHGQPLPGTAPVPERLDVGTPPINTGYAVSTSSYSGSFASGEDQLQTPTNATGPSIRLDGFPMGASSDGEGASGTSTPLARLASPIPAGLTNTVGPGMVMTDGGSRSPLLVPTTATPNNLSPNTSTSILNTTSPLQPVASADHILAKDHPATAAGQLQAQGQAQRKSSSASSRHSMQGQSLQPQAQVISSSQSVGGGDFSQNHSHGQAQAQQRVTLVAPHSPVTTAAPHTPAELIHKVKEKVKSRRGSRSSHRNSLGPGDMAEDGTSGHPGKRERLKNRLRGLSDASGTRHPGGSVFSDDRSSRLSDQESDTTESSYECSEDEDDHSRLGGHGRDRAGSELERATTRSSISRMSLPVTGFAVASNKRNLEFHALFGQIDEGDYLIEDYGCALQKDILVHGRIYVSEHHLSFHSNILGWVTDLVIAFADITSIEKKMTAFVIPNGISITTRQGKHYVFASFIARDATFDVFINVWRQAHSRTPSLDGGDDQEISESPVQLTAGSTNGASKTDSSKPAVKRGPTKCACGEKGEHYTEKAMEAVFPSSPESVYNLMFPSQFMRSFMSDNQKLTDIQMSDWTPREPGSKLLKRNFSYIKPLNGGIGPKQTKCEISDELDHMDPDKYISVITTTRTPDVPSGNVFSVKTRTCLVWASARTTKVLVTTKVEWTGRSFIKGIIEKSAVDGQKTYHRDLETAMRQYIKEHASEFKVEGGDDPAGASDEPAPEVVDEPVVLEKAGAVEPAGRRNRERDANAFQAAFDSVVQGIITLCEGIFGLAKTSIEVLSELPMTKESLIGLVIAILLISNIWTYSSLKQTKNMVNHDERRARREARLGTPASKATTIQKDHVSAAVKAYFEGRPLDLEPLEPLDNLDDEVKQMMQQLSRIEERIGAARLHLVASRPVTTTTAAAETSQTLTDEVVTTTVYELE